MHASPFPAFAGFKGRKGGFMFIPMVLGGATAYALDRLGAFSSGTHSGSSGKIDGSVPSHAYDEGHPISAAIQNLYSGSTLNTAKNLLQSATSSIADSVSSLGSSLGNSVSNLPNMATGVPSGSYTVYPSDGGTSVAAPNYLNADLAKAYGMDASTAYQEALSNTSYQRAVADLRAAGLNPVLAASGLVPAGGVYGARLAGDGTISTGVSSGAGVNHNSYKVLSNIGGLIGAGIGAFAGKSPSAALLGYRAGSGVGSAVGNLIDFFG